MDFHRYRNVDVYTSENNIILFKEKDHFAEALNEILNPNGLKNYEDDDSSNKFEPVKFEKNIFSEKGEKGYISQILQRSKSVNLLKAPNIVDVSFKSTKTLMKIKFTDLIN